eukprot:UN05575
MVDISEWTFIEYCIHAVVSISRLREVLSEYFSFKVSFNKSDVNAKCKYKYPQ